MLQVSDLRHQAKARLLTVSGNPKKLVLIHAAIALGSSFLLTVINYLFSLQIENTGGLGGLGTRSVLATAQSVLELTVMLALPFWQMGIYYAALQWIRGESAEFGSLLQGFRRFSSVLGMLLLRSLLFIALAITVVNIGSFVFIMTPFAAPLLEILTPIMEQGATPEQLEALLTPELMGSVSRASIPLFILLGVLYIAVAVPLFYRLRFGDFAVMEGLPAGRALLKSFAITHKKFWQVFKLDLSFWWFYLLQMLSVALCYADTLLPAMGIALPVSGVTAAFIFYALGSICQCLLLWQWEGSRVTVYGLAYHTLDGTIGANEPVTED